MKYEEIKVGEQYIYSEMGNRFPVTVLNKRIDSEGMECFDLDSKPLGVFDVSRTPDPKLQAWVTWCLIPPGRMW